MTLQIPPIGFGTFGSDKYTPEAVSAAVKTAIQTGYRLFDCASIYGNEAQIGQVFHDCMAERLVQREALFVISKVWNDKHGEVIASCMQSLADLQLDYLDMYFVHWPFPNHHAPGCDIHARSQTARSFHVKEFMAVWRQMEWLQTNGLVKHIAMSNMTIPKLAAVLPLCDIRPAAHEMELHPSFQQKALFDYCVENGLQPIGYCPIGSPNRPQRDQSVDDVVDTALPTIVDIAKAHGISPASVCIQWAIQRGSVPIPFSCNPTNIQRNFECVTNPPLTPAEMAEIEKLDQNCRLVKGHVFLWEGARDWHDLWDENNVIVQ